MKPAADHRPHRRALAGALADLADLFAPDLPAESARLLSQAANVYASLGSAAGERAALQCRATARQLRSLTRWPPSRPGVRRQPPPVVATA